MESKGDTRNQRAYHGRINHKSPVQEVYVLPWGHGACSLLGYPGPVSYPRDSVESMLSEGGVDIKDRSDVSAASLISSAGPAL
jgi:hypothetical protein